jgi:hypothetical protein
MIGPVRHDRCTHRNYLLTCSQYEALLNRAAGRCEICGLLASENPGGKLYIDHDHALGAWAVRGLLCQLCNTLLRSPESRTKLGYDTSAFHLALAGETRLSEAVEPALMTVVRDHAQRPWQRDPEGWWPRFPRPAQHIYPVSWRRLISLYGPHNLRLSAFGGQRWRLGSPEDLSAGGNTGACTTCLEGTNS